ncbi:MAG: DNA gyrase/topoisomerase IV subunit A, partial [Candidatus Marinimicrobia bacterium]|nr:DNA gyrase/topoisomerase IV subunit A [Candidatus Neomarinimicrobiota bacterium]
YTIRYFEALLKKYGNGRERRTEIATFESIAVRSVAVANQKLFVNREEGFIGSSLKKDEYIGDCSDIDNIIVFRADGKYQVTQMGIKKFVGKDIIHAAVWKKNDEHMIYNVAYRDGKAGKSMVKRFSVTSIVRDREYDVTGGTADSSVTYFTANPNSESEVVAVNLHGLAKARIKTFDFDFGELAIKGRASKGNILSKHPVRKIVQKSVGDSTLGGRDIWLDENIGRLTTEDRGRYLGSFNTDDLIVVIHEDGAYELTSFDLSNRYKCNEIKHIGKFNPDEVITAVHYDGKSKSHYVKRFQIETSTTGKRFKFISEERGSKLLLVSVQVKPELVFNYRLKNGDKRTKEIILLDFIDVKGWKANGNKLGGFSRMSGFKINELQVEAATDAPTADTPAEQKDIPIEAPKDANGDELSLF